MIDILYRRPVSGKSSSSWSYKDKDAKEINQPPTIEHDLVAGIPQKLGFDQLMSGQTCVPCTAHDFINYLRYVEHDGDGFQFFLWFQDYKRRFFNLPEVEQNLSPVHIIQPRDLSSQIALSESASSSQRTSAISDVSFGSDIKIQPFTVQPFREEVSRVINIYLLRNAALELEIPMKIRNTTLKALRQTTHPSAFELVIRHVEAHIRETSHPKFVRHSLSNANPARVRMIYCFATFNIAIGLLINLLFILSHHSRFLRLISCLFFLIGTLGIANAKRGLCVVSIALGHKRSLQPWEVYAVDQEKGLTGLKDQKERFALENKDEEVRIRVFVREYDNKPVLSRIYERRVPVVDKELRRLQLSILMQSLVTAICVTLALGVCFVMVPAANLY